MPIWTKSKIRHPNFYLLFTFSLFGTPVRPMFYISINIHWNSEAAEIQKDCILHNLFVYTWNRLIFPVYIATLGQSMLNLEIKRV